MNDELSSYDRQARYCPKLGHEVPFGYCRAAGDELPCRQIVGCWSEVFDVRAFLKSHWSAERLARLSEPPPDRLATLVELVERARRSGGMSR